MALSGATGWLEGLSFVDLVLGFLQVAGGLSTALDRTTYIGLTDNEFIFAIAKDPNKPSRLQRVPLGNVSIVKFRESRTPLLIDVLVIDTRTMRLTLSTGRTLRPVVRELAATLTRRSQEVGTTDAAGHAQGTPAKQAARLPLHVRLYRPLAFALGEVSATLRADGPALASIRASRYSFALFAASIAADFVFIFGLVPLGSILPTGLFGSLRDFLLFILLLPVLLAALLGLVAAFGAAGLAIYSIFKRGERPLTIIAALLRAVAILMCYALAAFGALLLGGE
jgi:hypothetical protein